MAADLGGDYMAIQYIPRILGPFYKLYKIGQCF